MVRYDYGKERVVMLKKDEKLRINSIVSSRLSYFLESFKKRHIGKAKSAKGSINMKSQNVFINKLPRELMYYSALVRSFDSAFGHVLENIALEIARNYYHVSQEVVGKIDVRQSDHINDILTNYNRRKFKPEVGHYANYNTPPFSLGDIRHNTDHLFYDDETQIHHIIELKAGGDLDNKKARAEKQALLEQFFILKNKNENAGIKLHFATAYNKFGEGNKWVQPNVETFFAKEELLIGKDFWNFVCKNENGFDVVIEAYNQNIHIIVQALEEIKEAYGI